MQNRTICILQNNKKRIEKGYEKEEYIWITGRESGSPAERPLQGDERWKVALELGCGTPKKLWVSTCSRLYPPLDGQNEDDVWLSALPDVLCLCDAACRTVWKSA